MSKTITIGVLALQGDFERHEEMLLALRQHVIRVRTTNDLCQCDGLIIPGGESTTLLKLLKKQNMWKALLEYGKIHPIYGTCAGCIILADTVVGMDQESLKLVDVSVKRNAYGRQIDSFIDDIKISLNGTTKMMEGVFIRAPKIVSMGAEVKPLAWHQEDVVLAEQDSILVGTFHPELTRDLAVHRYFINLVKDGLNKTGE